MSFKLGDIVQYKRGTKHYRVIYVSKYGHKRSYDILAEDGYNCHNDIPEHKLKLVETQTEETQMSEELYQIKETEKYGKKIAVNSQGKIVLEIKGTGEVVAVDKTEIEEVFPYTFEVKFFGNSNVYAFLGKEGQVEKGDILIYTSGPYEDNICQVVATDTKSRKATKEFKGLKIKSEPFGN